MAGFLRQRIAFSTACSACSLHLEGLGLDGLGRFQMQGGGLA
jgi:hypothetical protein